MKDELRLFFEQYKDKIDRRAKEAKEHQAKADAINAEIREQQARLQNGPPSPDSCPDCWMERGADSRVIAATSSDPAHFDKWLCEVCGFFVEVPSR